MLSMVTVLRFWDPKRRGWFAARALLGRKLSRRRSPKREARTDGRGERQKQTLGAVGGRVTEPEAAQGLSEDVFLNSNEKEVSA